VAVDIGGGQGEYFVDRARGEPQKTFVILEPAPLSLPDKPPNLHIIRWKSTAALTLPFADKSIDEVNINYLFGKMEPSRLERHRPLDQKEIYRRLIKDARQVLKSGGKISIIDAHCHINLIKEILIESGYHIVQEPISLPDPDRTYWSGKFTEDYERNEESFVAPMIIEAQK